MSDINDLLGLEGGKSRADDDDGLGDVDAKVQQTLAKTHVRSKPQGEDGQPAAKKGAKKGRREVDALTRGGRFFICGAVARQSFFHPLVAQVVRAVRLNWLAVYSPSYFPSRLFPFVRRPLEFPDFPSFSRHARNLAIFALLLLSNFPYLPLCAYHAAALYKLRNQCERNKNKMLTINAWTNY